MNNITRQTGMVLAIALLLSACGGSKPEAGSAAPPAASASATSAAQTDAEKVLNVYNWSDYIDEAVIKEFETEYGIKVNYDVFDSNEVVETKLLAGSTGYDIVVPSASFLERQITAGVFQPLDTARLSNLKKPRSGHHPARRAARSGQQVFGQLPVGHLGRRLQRRDDQQAHAGRAGRQLAMFYDPAVVAKFKPIAAWRCSMRHPKWWARC
jgi:ABC-type glycerol-3-phosphate transport system substrate-binding protein